MKIRRSMCLAALAFCLIVSSVNPADARAGSAAPVSLPAVALHAESAALIDVASGRILYGLRENKRMRIASLTKIMTAITAIENGRLDDKVTVGPNAVRQEGSSIYLKQKENIRLLDLLYGLMLRSGNDAAVAVAEHVGGSEMGFVYLMNRKAEEIGMTNSRFMNPHGLDNKDHYSTAADMARLTAYALQRPEFREIVKTPVKKVQREGESWLNIWINKNKMLRIYEGSDGVKTGFTRQAGRCLVSSATRGGRQLAVVTLNDPDDWSDHAKLLDYGFRTFTPERLVAKGETIEGRFSAAQSFVYPLAEKERVLVTRRIRPESRNTVPYKFGQMGQMDILLDGVRIGTVSLTDSGKPATDGDAGAAGAAPHKKTANDAAMGWLGMVRSLAGELFHAGWSGRTG